VDLPVHIVEHTLPKKYGGSVTDYQIVERVEDGFTKLDILVSPDLGELDEEDALVTVFSELRREGVKSGSANLSVDVWEGTGTVRIRREYPKQTIVGKIFSFQIDCGSRPKH